MFSSDPIHVNIVEIILAGLALFVGLYARQGTQYERQAKHFSGQTKDIYDRQKQENEQLKNA